MLCFPLLKHQNLEILFLHFRFSLLCLLTRAKPNSRTLPFIHIYIYFLILWHVPTCFPSLPGPTLALFELHAPAGAIRAAAHGDGAVCPSSPGKSRFFFFPPCASQHLLLCLPWSVISSCTSPSPLPFNWHLKYVMDIDAGGL